MTSKPVNIVIQAINFVGDSPIKPLSTKINDGFQKVRRLLVFTTVGH